MMFKSQENIHYVTAHDRVRAERGRADLYTCPCGKPAKQWAYDNKDPNQIRVTQNKNGRKYFCSLDANHYIAMCVSCHKQFDLIWVRFNNKY